MQYVRDIMTENPECCTDDMNLEQVARMMCEANCGEIPVVDDLQNLRPVGVITDRDIVCRTLAKGKNPLETKVEEAMTTPCITVTPDTSLDECCRVLEQNRIRRVPVVDKQGKCCGIVSQADIALNTPGRKTAEVVRVVSQSA